jgi:hypothetical protein
MDSLVERNLKLLHGVALGERDDLDDVAFVGITTSGDI